MVALNINLIIMIRYILFYGFIISGLIYAVFTLVIMDTLRKNGYYVTILNIDFSDFKNLRDLAEKNHKYRFMYLAYIASVFVPLVFMGLLIFVMLSR